MFLLGHWKDFDELEQALSLDEIEHILNAKSESEMQHRKFLASIQGIQLDEPEQAEGPGFVEKFKAKQSASKFSGFGYSQEG